MPELPEVEITRRGIARNATSQTVTHVIVRNRNLRWPIPHNLAKKIKNAKIESVARRGKYLLLHTNKGTLIIHLGMSGTLRVLTADHPIKKHDHVDIKLSNDYSLCFNDPRRFGTILWSDKNPEQHPLLSKLGIEPFADNFCGDYLYNYAQRRSIPVKQFIMDAHVVVGVGNIYASEALFKAGVNPQAPANTICKSIYNKLATAIKKVLMLAIENNGTTLRDFVSSDGARGEFVDQLQVYGRNNKQCYKCNSTIQKVNIGQRSSYFCPKCQK